MSVAATDSGALPAVAVAMMASLYQHRLLSTMQLRVLHTPGKTIGWTRQILRALSQRGLIDRVQGPGTRALWYLSEHGADTLQAAGALAEPRRRLTSAAQAAGPLRAHTIAVNDTAIAFLRAARERGDECTTGSWRHEVAHPISPARGRRPGELLIADALLSYLQNAPDGGIFLHQRFIELDRGTARPAEQLAGKITRYARLRHYTIPGDTQPLWRTRYRSFPRVLIVLADQTPTSPPAHPENPRAAPLRPHQRQRRDSPRLLRDPRRPHRRRPVRADLHLR